MSTATGSRPGAKLADRGKDEYVEPDKRPKNIMTMHALGLRIIEQNASAIGLVPGVSLVSDADLKAALMRDAALLAGLDEAAGKQAHRDKEQANAAASEDTKRVLETYTRILRACNAVDYDDQIAIACDILEGYPEVLEEYQGAARHLLIDEYQDINADQHRLIRLLSGGQESGLFAVGDDDQSVYGFRGGDPRYIRSFHTDYPGAKILQLKVSRRCLKNILDCALAVVAKYDATRVAKVAPGYTQTEPGLVRVWNCPSETREAEVVARAILRRALKGEADDFFVLVPTKNYIKPIVQALAARRIDHDVGTSSEKSPEWTTLVALRGWLEQPENLSTRHVIELVLGAGTTSMPGQRVKKPDKVAARAEFARSIAELWRPVLDEGKQLADAFQASAASDGHVEEVWKLVTAVRHAYQDDAMPSFLESVGEALAIFPTIQSFYSCLQFLENTPGALGATKSKVRILTFRNSKGLEADCVFIIGLEEGTLPRDPTNAQTTAEEARMIFVAMTRAKKELVLTHARKRTGASTYKALSHQLSPSAFVTCLPAGQCKKEWVKPAAAVKKAKAASHSGS